jgi:hypothetical protein
VEGGTAGRRNGGTAEGSSENQFLIQPILH